MLSNAYAVRTVVDLFAANPLFTRVFETPTSGGHSQEVLCFGQHGKKLSERTETSEREFGLPIR